ncbi:Protein of unknown function, partial [Gryllus bimaculatus]
WCSDDGGGDRSGVRDGGGGDGGGGDGGGGGDVGTDSFSDDDSGGGDFNSRDRGGGEEDLADVGRQEVREGLSVDGHDDCAQMVSEAPENQAKDKEEVFHQWLLGRTASMIQRLLLIERQRFWMEVATTSIKAKAVRQGEILAVEVETFVKASSGDVERERSATGDINYVEADGWALMCRVRECSSGFGNEVRSGDYRETIGRDPYSGDGNDFESTQRRLLRDEWERSCQWRWQRLRRYAAKTTDTREEVILPVEMATTSKVRRRDSRDEWERPWQRRRARSGDCGGGRLDAWEGRCPRAGWGGAAVRGRARAPALALRFDPCCPLGGAARTCAEPPAPPAPPAHCQGRRRGAATRLLVLVVCERWMRQGGQKGGGGEGRAWNEGEWEGLNLRGGVGSSPTRHPRRHVASQVSQPEPCILRRATMELPGLRCKSRSRSSG